MLASVKEALRGFKYFFSNYIVCYIPIYFVRIGWLRLLGAKIHTDACIHIGVKIFGPFHRLKIGENTVVNPEVRLDARSGLTIKNNVSISREVFILSLGHNYNDKDFALQGESITIEDHVWIGIRAMVMPGVTLAEGCVIGAGAVVTKDTEAWSVYAGVPAKKIGQRLQQEYSSIYYKPFFGATT